VKIGCPGEFRKTTTIVEPRFSQGVLVMTLKDGTKEHSHEVAKDAKITCDGKDCKLEDLKKGFMVKVTTDKKDGKELAVRIEAKSK
jgi:hypothetical protein